MCIRDSKLRFSVPRDPEPSDHTPTRTTPVVSETPQKMCIRDRDWTECIRVNNASGDTELMFVNSALNNSMDKKDGTSKSKTVKKNGKKADHGLTARRASREMSLKEALKSFQEMKFDGCTFVSDRCV